MAEDSSDESELGIALKRDRRSNAGARMSRLLEAEDEDDFYKTTYGGFTEEADDDDYKSERSNSDVTDSDIDINEDDELKSDDDADKKEKKTFSSVYKDPKKFGKSEVCKTHKPKLNKTEHSTPIEVLWEKKSIRKSTAEKSKCTEGILKEREAKAALSKLSGDKRKIPEMRRLTQEELLAEAKITEEINLASLETYQKMELEKKKQRSHRQVHLGPTIKFHSISLPIDSDEHIDIDIIQCLKKEAKELPPSKKCARNFITFTDEKLFNKYFPAKDNPEPTPKQQCVVTGLPAKYLDPLTLLPYANIEAFKVIREAYRQKMLTDKVENERKYTKQSLS